MVAWLAIALFAAQLETTFTTEYSGKKYVSRITEQDLRAAPSWPVNQENPPLSPRRAVDAASKYLATLLPNGKNWRLYQVTLKPVENYWIYIVEFLEPVAQERQTSAGFSVVVLMNGVPVRPKIE